MQKISPFLWFDHQAEEAMNFYVSVFKNAQVGTVSRYGKGAPVPEGTVMACTFTLEGLEFQALNGGPVFTFNPAISLFVDCVDQLEVDTLWNKLCEGGAPGQCGWLTDKFGLSWQIVPRALSEYLSDPDPAKAGRVMAAMMQMTKIDIAALKKAHAGA